MYALKISINERETVTGGATDLCVLSAIISLTGKLGPEAAPRRDDGSVDIDLRVGGLTARADGAADEHLEWLRTNLQAGDVVSIRVVETDVSDPVISGHEAERIADDERAYFEHCKKAYLEMREKYEPTSMLQKGTRMFSVGQDYTRDEIHDKVGGSKQSYLPTNNGSVVAACLTHELNPQAPRVILCGRGARIEPAGKLLSQQPYAIPVFLKRAVNRWEYKGFFKATASYTSGPEFDSHVSGAGRPPSEVSRVVVMSEIEPDRHEER